MLPHDGYSSTQTKQWYLIDSRCKLPIFFTCDERIWGWKLKSPTFFFSFFDQIWDIIMKQTKGYILFPIISQFLLRYYWLMSQAQYFHYICTKFLIGPLSLIYLFIGGKIEVRFFLINLKRLKRTKEGKKKQISRDWCSCSCSCSCLIFTFGGE